MMIHPREPLAAARAARKCIAASAAAGNRAGADLLPRAARPNACRRRSPGRPPICRRAVRARRHDDGDMPATPAVSTSSLVDLDGDKTARHPRHRHAAGRRVSSGAPASAGGGLSVVASVPHPSHVTLTDVDRDGLQDLLVADLGEFFPADHDKGAVIWLRGLPGGKVRSVLARRLAARRRRRGGGLQRRRQERI